MDARIARRRLMVGFCVFELAGVGLVAGLLGYRAASAAGLERTAAGTVVTVTAGKPSEFVFTLSKSSAPAWQAKNSGTVTFKVTNKGALSHRFEVCTTPVKSATLNVCNGLSTKLLEPGQSATLTFICKVRGTYEFLSSAPGQAAKGMKGLIAIGVSLSAPSAPSIHTSKPAPIAPATTSPPSPALTAAAAAGAALFESGGCSSCHALAEVRAAGTVGPNLNSTHTGGSFPDGPLTVQQIADLAAYING